MKRQIRRRAFRELSAKCRKIGKPRLAEDCNLSIHYRVMSGKVLRSRRDRLEFRRPIQPGPRVNCDFAVIDVQLRSIAIKLDLMNPVCAIRRPLLQRRVAGLNEFWEGGLSCAEICQTINRGRSPSTANRGFSSLSTIWNAFRGVRGFGTLPQNSPPLSDHPFNPRNGISFLGARG